MAIVKAQKSKRKARVAIAGPSGSGKTFTALKIARGLVGPNGRIVVIDTERMSSALYAPEFGHDVCDKFDFGTKSPPRDAYSPVRYVEAIAESAAAADVIVIDGLSQAWNATGGALDQVDAAAAKSSGNSYAAWRTVTPQHNDLVEAMVGCPCHLVVTMRSKTEYALEKNEQGKNVPKKIGMAPIQRDGMEYEFDVFGDMDLDNTLRISKTRYSKFAGAVIRKPDEEVGAELAAWLSDGADAPQRPAQPPATAPAEPPKKPSTEPGSAAIQRDRLEIGNMIASACGLSLADRAKWSDADKAKFGDTLQAWGNTEATTVGAVPDANVRTVLSLVTMAHAQWKKEQRADTVKV